MQYLFMGLFALVAVVADQITKWLTVKNLASSLCGQVGVNCQQHIETIERAFSLTKAEQFALPTSREGIPGLFHFCHVHNPGAAWSSFNGMIWLFALVFAGFAAFIVWEFPKKRLPFHTFERWCIVSVFAGGLGNMIDRLHLGYVVDMIKVDFMEFPVFNVADCFITCGCIALMVSLVFFNKEFWKDEKKCS